MAKGKTDSGRQASARRKKVPVALLKYPSTRGEDESLLTLVDDGQVHEIPLNQIRPAPWNPPARMDYQTVEELSANIALHGQQVPGLVRPVEADAPVRFELVFGHRRFAAISRLAPPEGSGTIRAFVRPLSEENAMILSGIENLQRKGFSDIEEAEFFRTCGDRYGESAVKMLSEKLSVSERYIRKRIEVLKLPERALKLWRDGTWHVGHMEQLLRIGAPEEIEGFMEELQKGHFGYQQTWMNLEVYRLREIIDRRAVSLGCGKFAKDDCKVCRKNTAVQKTFFGGYEEKAKTYCLDQKCFEKKQAAWYELHWSDCKQNKFGTLAAVVSDYNTKAAGTFDAGAHFGYGKPSDKCFECPNFSTLVDIKGELRTMGERVCMGDSRCYAAVKGEGKKGNSSQSQTSSGSAGDDDAPRVAWHGEHHRQEFYQQEVPGLLAGLLTEDPRRLQLGLACMVFQSNHDTQDWFFQKIELPTPERKYSLIYLRPILDAVKTLKPLQIEYLLSEIAIQNSFIKPRDYGFQYNDHDRAAIAEFLDIDFSKWVPTDEWFEKKTKAELVSYIARESGLARDAKFQDYLVTYHLTLEKLASLKKGVIVQILQNCGCDLRGRLPDEMRSGLRG